MVQSVSCFESAFRKIFLLLIISSGAVLLFSPVSAGNGVTITAQGDQKYYYGEEIVLAGYNNETDTTYLSMTGPNLPEKGAGLNSPRRNATSGDPGSFTTVKTGPDHSWEYSFYTSDLRLDAGMYTIYVAGQPRTRDQLDNAPSGHVSIIVMMPFVMAEISPSPVIKGEPFTVTGTAEGDPGEVQIWIFCDNYALNTTVMPEANSTFTFSADPLVSDQLPKGQCYLIVQHPMQNNMLDIIASGDWVMNNQSGSTKLFKMSGPGSLQGSDAAGAFVSAWGDSGVDDTYTIIPFMVNDKGTPAPAVHQDTPLQTPSRPKPAPLQYAPVGAIVLMLGILLWLRH